MTTSRQGPKESPGGSDFITLHFDAGLRDLIRRRPPDRSFLYALERKASIKDIVEACGVPHTEVGEIRCRDRFVDFDHSAEPGNTYAIAGIVPPLDVLRPSLLRPAPFSRLRFVVDVNVAKLASLLRLLGFDTAYRNGIQDAEIARLAEVEERIVLTRDTALLKRSRITFGRLVRAVHPDDQFREVLDLFGLNGPFALFSRCMVCNHPLAFIDKHRILNRLEPKTKKYFDVFKHCPACDKIYWRGSHYDEMMVRLEKIGVAVLPDAPPT
jgi:uncharacterized protein